MGAPHALLSVKMCGLSSVFAAAWCTRSVPVLVSVKISSVFRQKKSGAHKSKIVRVRMAEPVSVGRGGAPDARELAGGEIESRELAGGEIE